MATEALEKAAREYWTPRAGRLACLTVAGFLVFGCSEPAPRSVPQEATDKLEGKLISDTQSLLRAELEEADRAFARAVRDTRLEGWVAAFAEDGMVLPADGPPARGPDAIRELYAPLFADPGFEMTWTPVGARVASSGDLGFTFGDWRTSISTARDEQSESDGKYVTVWRRERGGPWRVLLDIGNQRE